MQSQNKTNSDQMQGHFDTSFKMLAEISPAGIYLTDRFGRCLYVNPAWCRMSGLTPAQAAKDGWVKAIHPEDRNRIHSKWKRFIRGEISWASEYRLIDKKGNTTLVYGNASTLKDPGGSVQCIIGINLDITKKKITEKKLRDSQRKIQKLATHLEKVRENERSQIALNIHDDLGQKLTALNLDIAWLKSRIGIQSQAVRNKLEEMTLMINETIESIKEISSFLRPSILFDLGLVTAFDLLLKKFEKQSRIKYHFHYEPEEFKIDNHISLILYRILQESLTNIARHSEASVAHVNLQLVKNRLQLLITDNGKGIEKDEINSLTSMGITGMKERVRSVYGKLFIKGIKGSGTIINISVPIKKKRNYD